MGGGEGIRRHGQSDGGRERRRREERVDYDGTGVTIQRESDERSDDFREEL